MQLYTETVHICIVFVYVYVHSELYIYIVLIFVALSGAYWVFKSLAKVVSAQEVHAEKSR